MPKPSSASDVAVVGGGVIGLSIAWRAAQRGRRVVLLERGEPGAGTSSVAAGMLAPVSEASLNEQAVLGLGLRSAELYPAFVEELQACAGADPGYLSCGTLAVARDRDEAEALERELQLRVGLGLSVQRLRASQARGLEPGLAPSLRLALLVESDHAVDPRRLCHALARAAGAAGVEVRAGVTVEALEDDGVRLIGGERIGAEQVVIAAGTWAGAIHGVPDSVRIPIRPVKGQIMRLHDPAGPGLITRVLRMAGGYLVPRGDGRYVLGATMEERGFDTTVTAGAVHDLLRDAAELVPGISELVVDELSAGLRPATPDNVPVIGPASTPGLHLAIGHYRHGILLAPLTAEIVVAGLTGEELPEYAAAVSPARFSHVAVGA